MSIVGVDELTYTLARFEALVKANEEYSKRVQRELSEAPDLWIVIGNHRHKIKENGQFIHDRG